MCCQARPDELSVRQDRLQKRNADGEWKYFHGRHDRVRRSGFYAQLNQLDIDLRISSYSADQSALDFTSQYLYGTKLFGGTTSAPTFTDGAYELTNSVAGTGGSAGSGSANLPAISLGVTGGLAATNVNATPEPSSLVLLGTGVLGLAGVARRRLRNI